MRYNFLFRLSDEHFQSSRTIITLMRQFFQSLQARLILLVILVVIPGLVGLAYQTLEERESAIDIVLQRAIDIVESTTVRQAKLIENTQSFLMKLSTFPPIQDPNSLECSRFLADILKLNNHYINLGVPRPDGTLLCNAKPLKKAVNVSDRPYIQRAILTRDFSIGKFQLDRAADVISINFAYPVINPVSDEITGIAVAVISLDWWSLYLSQAYLPKHSKAYITDHENKIIATYPSNALVLGSYLKGVQGTQLDNNAVFEPTNRIIENEDGHRRVFVSRPLFDSRSHTNITLSVSIPVDEALSAINFRFTKMLGLLFPFIILMFVIALVGVRQSVLTPLATLLRLTKNLALGKSIDAIALNGSSEIVELQRNFILMARTRLTAEKQLKDSQHSLQESKSKLSLHIENTPLGCISWDENFICTEWNKSAEAIFGYSPNEAIGRSGTELIITPDKISEIKKGFSSLLKQTGGFNYANENVTKNGKTIFCEWHNTPILSQDGGVEGITSLVQDVTARKQLEERLVLAASVFSHSREGIMIVDAKGIILDVNDAVVEITGYSRDEIIGKNPNVFKSNRQSKEFYAQLWGSLTREGYWSGEIWNKRKNRDIYPQLLTISSVNDESGKLKNYVAVFTDISELKHQQHKLEHLVHYDPLTNLPNRSLLTDRLEQALIQSNRNKQFLAVLFLDLDGFKTINDEYGHNCGDELLIGLSSNMKNTLREGDTISRFGGDEFVILLANLENTKDLELLLERLLRAASAPVTINDAVLTISASIGVTLYPLDNANAEQLIRHADQAMYVAKQKGKGCSHQFDPISDDRENTQRKSIEEIATALDNREFVLYYQPQINMKTREVIAVEALIRWEHPKRGLLSPIEFLPLIENHELSIEVGNWVVDESLRQISKWQGQGLDLTVSINISALQLKQSNFPEQLATSLAAHPNVAASALQLEILETSALGDIGEISEVMDKCIKLGVVFAIDDFGTGYSSLTYLRRLPVNMIKIDRTFIRDMLVDPEDRAIVLGIIGLAASFDREVIAEGVETDAHSRELLKLGCQLAQGYGIARPMPSEKVLHWVTSR